MFKKLLILSCLFLTACASNEKIAVVVDVQQVSAIVPADVEKTNVTLQVLKDSDNNTLYAFDEINFVKLKKFLLDVTKNNNNSRDLLCYYNQKSCENKEKK